MPRKLASNFTRAVQITGVPAHLLNIEDALRAARDNSESVREGIREKTLEGLDTAVRKGKFGGRPSVVSEDMLAIALHRRDARGESVSEIARTLLQTDGRKGEAGQPHRFVRGVEGP
ncbi:hypothetical protein PV396_43375 [Streptomyces sp. ME02-8801-2C]|uniref:hypothetical protein n=1 Tax=Streptomyces sp. ME02-8801-2C TaxID=3028680 RepID=UPI0029A896ED|nr:hypothetical protein [Streptomyces sp. ME02-8801-2C]MDX3458694.1 hypothetical protein [Streptomyces sp. ME02-8801-2C]